MSNEHISDRETSTLPERVASLESSRTTGRWIIALVVPAVLALSLMALEKAQTSAENTGYSRATIESLKTTIEKLDRDIGLIRLQAFGLSDAPDSAGDGLAGVVRGTDTYGLAAAGSP